MLQKSARSALKCSRFAFFWILYAFMTTKPRLSSDLAQNFNDLTPTSRRLTPTFPVLDMAYLDWRTLKQSERQPMPTWTRHMPTWPRPTRNLMYIEDICFIINLSRVILMCFRQKYYAFECYMLLTFKSWMAQLEYDLVQALSSSKATTKAFWVLGKRRPGFEVR